MRTNLLQSNSHSLSLSLARLLAFCSVLHTYTHTERKREGDIGVHNVMSELNRSCYLLRASIIIFSYSTRFVSDNRKIVFYFMLISTEHRRRHHYRVLLYMYTRNFWHNQQKCHPIGVAGSTTTICSTNNFE